MSLKTKVDPFGLSATGWTVVSTEENRSIEVATANNNTGFQVASTAFGEKVGPTFNYMPNSLTNEASLGSITLGKVKEYDNHKIVATSIQLNSQAGQPMGMTINTAQVEDTLSANQQTPCFVTLYDQPMSTISYTSLFHAHTFGLFTVSNGQLQSSTCDINADLATADKDGTIVASDLVGGTVTINATLVGVDNSGNIATPTVSLNTYNGNAGTFTQPLSESNPNGDYPTYTFTAVWPLQASHDD